MDYSSIFLALMGVSTAFLGLICIGVWRLSSSRTTDTAPSAAPAVATAPVSQTFSSPVITNELIAAISAAIAEDLGTDISGIRITSIRRV